MGALTSSRAPRVSRFRAPVPTAQYRKAQARTPCQSWCRVACPGKDLRIIDAVTCLSPRALASSRRSDATPTGYDCRELMSRHIRGTLFSRDVISHDTCAIVPIQRTRSPRSAPRMALGPAHPFRLLTSRKNHGYRVSKLLPTGRRLFYRWCLHPLNTITASLESVNSDTVHDDAISTHTTPTRHLRTDQPSTTLVHSFTIVGHCGSFVWC